jgi:5'-nucleotidase
MTLILCDVDGVIFDFNEGLRRLTELSKEESIKRIAKHGTYVGNAEAAFGKELFLTAMTSPRFWSRLPVIEKNLNQMKKWMSDGHSVAFVTAPWEGADPWISIRKKALDKHFGGHRYSYRRVYTHDKELVAGDILIEDKPENLKKWLANNKNGRGYLVDWPYNRDEDVGTRIVDLTEIEL